MAELIRRDVAQALRDLKDPRITGILTVSAVELTRDLSIARVYYGVLGAQEDAALDSGLEHAAGYLRRRLGRALHLRRVPELRFVRLPEGRILPAPEDLPAGDES